jgi:hypothetical protein
MRTAVSFDTELCFCAIKVNKKSLFRVLPAKLVTKISVSKMTPWRGGFKEKSITLSRLRNPNSRTKRYANPDTYSNIVHSHADPGADGNADGDPHTQRSICFGIILFV